MRGESLSESLVTHHSELYVCLLKHSDHTDRYTEHRPGLARLGLREKRLINIFMQMRRLCLIIFVIPAPAEAAAGFDVPAVDLN